MKKYLILGLGFLATDVMSSGCSAQTSSATAPASIMEEATTLVIPTGTLYGTLEVPASRKPVPVVLIIAGSGPTDRDGNSKVIPGANNSLKLLASGLAANGIASLRYDKRGIAASAAAATKEEDVRFDDFVADAEGWLKKLRADKRFSTVSVAGHSEGSLIGMIAAREAGADGYISLEGAGRKPAQIILEQLAPQVPAEMLATSRHLMERIEAGEPPDSTPVPPVLLSLFRPSVRPYMMSWFKYDPAVEIAKLKIPALVVQGTTDIQTSMTDANALAKGYPTGRLLIVEGMNHVLKTAPAGRAEQMNRYTDPSFPIVPKLMDETVAFVKSLKKKS